MLVLGGTFSLRVQSFTPSVDSASKPVVVLKTIKFLSSYESRHWTSYARIFSSKSPFYNINWALQSWNAITQLLDLDTDDPVT